MSTYRIRGENRFFVEMDNPIVVLNLSSLQKKIPNSFSNLQNVDVVFQAVLKCTRFESSTTFRPETRRVK